MTSASPRRPLGPAATLLIAFSIIMLLTLEWLRGRSEKLRTQQPS